MLTGDGALGCVPLLGTSVLSVGSRDFLSHQGPLSLCPAEGAVGNGSETWRNSAGCGRGPSLPLLWKTKQALSPLLKELAPCPLRSDPATLSSPASTHAVACLGRQKAAELPHPSWSWSAVRTNSAVGAGCHNPCARPELQGGQRDGMWDVPAWGPAAANKAASRWGVSPRWEGWGSMQCLLWAGDGRTELLWQWLICELGCFVHVSLDSLVYFFKAGGCFLNSKVLLCNFPNKAF